MPAGTFLRQVGDACEMYLPVAAKQRLLAVAKRQPWTAMPRADSDAQLAREMERNPAEAEAHIATDL